MRNFILLIGLILAPTPIHSQGLELDTREVQVLELEAPPQPRQPGQPPAAGPRRKIIAQNVRRSYPPGFLGELPRPEPALIIRAAPPLDPSLEDQLQHDISVMNRLLQKAVGEIGDHPDHAMGIPVVALGPRSARNLYIEGYGLVFTLHVGIPLLPPGDQSAEPKLPAKSPNAEWEQARQELFGFKERTGEQPHLPGYDAGAVANLKKNLLAAFRHATNIRHLKPQDAITIVVRGRSRGALLLDAPHEGIFIKPEADVLVEQSSTSTMVLRIQKKDLDLSVNNEAAPADFDRHVTVTVY